MVTDIGDAGIHVPGLHRKLTLSLATPMRYLAPRVKSEQSSLDAIDVRFEMVPLAPSLIKPTCNWEASEAHICWMLRTNDEAERWKATRREKAGTTRAVARLAEKPQHRQH